MPGPDARSATSAEALAGATGALGAGVFLVGVTVVQVLAGESLSATYVSDYANGPFGTPFTVVALVHSASNLLLAAGIWSDARGAKPGRIGAGLFAAAAFGMTVAAIFRTDPTSSTPTGGGLVHDVAVAVAFPMELAALAFLAAHFRTREGWQRYATQTRATAVFVAAVLLWLLADLATGRVPGIPERVALFTLATWEGWTGVRLWRVHARRRLAWTQA